MTAFWDTAQCSFAEAYRRFRGAYCLYHQGEDIGHDDENYTAPHSTKMSSSHTLRRENLKSHFKILVLKFYRKRLNGWLTCEWEGNVK
jgi:hypothetical protein